VWQQIFGFLNLHFFLKKFLDASKIRFTNAKVEVNTELDNDPFGPF